MKGWMKNKRNEEYEMNKKNFFKIINHTYIQKHTKAEKNI